MKRDMSGRLAIDTSALIELVFSTPVGFKLKEALKNGLVEAHTTEFNIGEMKYILCRRLGLTESDEKVSKFLASGYVTVEDTSPLVSDVSRYKMRKRYLHSGLLLLSLSTHTVLQSSVR